MTAAVTVAMVGVIVVALGLVVVLAREPGPSPAEVVEAYELAWDRLDFETLWSLSGPELRDGRSRPDFVADKRAAYARRPELGGLARDVALEEVVTGSDAAVVRTRLELRDDSVVRNELRLERRGGQWLVVGYELRAAPDAAPAG